jgi:hypothetical protein
MLNRVVSLVMTNRAYDLRQQEGADEHNRETDGKTYTSNLAVVFCPEQKPETKCRPFDQTKNTRQGAMPCGYRLKLLSAIPG